MFSSVKRNCIGGGGIAVDGWGGGSLVTEMESDGTLLAFEREMETSVEDIRSSAIGFERNELDWSDEGRWTMSIESTPSSVDSAVFSSTREFDDSSSSLSSVIVSC